MASEHCTAHAMPGNVVVLWCGHCEGAEHRSLPMPVELFAEALARFGAKHAECKEVERAARA